MNDATGAAVPVSLTGAPKTGRSSLSKMVWAMTVAAAAVTLVTAFWGFSLAEKPDGWPAWQSIVLRTIKSLTPPLENLADKYASYPPKALTLMVIAQAAGAIFSILVVYRVLLLTLSVFFAEITLRGRRRHDVVIGSGPAAAEYVAGAERRTTHTAVELESAWGRVATLARVGSLDHQLARAGSGAARRIVVDEGDDATTWETAQSAARRYPNVDVVAYIQDSWINERLSRANPEASLRTFSYAGGVARQIMMAHPPYLLARGFKAPAQHILIFGFGAVGQALARELLITGTTIKPRKIMITVVDPDVERLKRDFFTRVPGLTPDGQKATGLEQDIDIAFVYGDLRVDIDAIIQELRPRHEEAEICAIYVSISGASLPFSFGVSLRDRAEELGMRAPIFLCAQHGAGLRHVRQGAGRVGLIAGDDHPDHILCNLQLVSFGSWRDALDGSGLFEPELDGYAQAFHARYLSRLEVGAKGAQPADAPWRKLADEYRVANRRAAAHIRAKADMVDFELNAWLEAADRESHELPPAANLFDLKDAAQVELLAELEHKRWMVERAMNSWRYGAVRDNRLKLHPSMKPWAELSEEEKEKDRANIRQVVETLRDVMPKGKRNKTR